MHVLILHQDLPLAFEASPDERDVMVQVKAVAAALMTLGHSWACFGVTENFRALREYIAMQEPNCIFNLVESLAGTDQRMAEVPRELDALGMRYTGAPWSSILRTNDKVRAKRRMQMLGLPTAAWATRERGKLSFPYIVKAIGEHASQGMDSESVVTKSARSVQEEIASRERSHPGIPFFAEQFIDGREFNVSLLAGPEGPQVLPLAEIDFSAFEATRPKIVDYAAKWDETAFAYHHTPRVFLDETRDAVLADSLRSLALRCWRAFGLRGYARIDFRVDASGQPWILEVNCNPCLSPDAGFAAALAQAGIAWEDAVQRILDAAM